MVRQFFSSIGVDLSAFKSQESSEDICKLLDLVVAYYSKARLILSVSGGADI